ncbi:MAG: 2,4-dihydroxyhept-2-ene-1,7-dioic acid aldolase [candidate division Zixibacteria bacterium]|nr:2,4-dihydroxyhept-2-ene-1,7-dioic acid aldolase [candidate division Zixibacteria bacterium]
MRPNRLRELLASGKPSLSTHIHTIWPSIVEVVGHAGLYDYVEFVGEYAPYDLHDLDHLCRAGELHNLGMMIKVDQEPRGFLAQRAIGSGFQSVLFADCRTPDEFKECIRLCKPDTPDAKGTYGVATRRFSYMGYGGSPGYAEALKDVVVAFMIEKASAVERIDEILAIDGIDMIQWGPADFTMSVGKAGQWHAPETRATERMVIEKSLAAGKHPRAEIGTADQAKYYLDMGVRHFCIGTDVTILYQWWKTQGEALKKAVEGV